jgi:hypothetical protein
MGTSQNLASDLYAVQDFIKQNPHQDWETVQESRPDYNPTTQWVSTKTPNPGWKSGDGANSDEWERKKMLHVDPKGRDRTSRIFLRLESLDLRPLCFGKQYDDCIGN